MQNRIRTENSVGSVYSDMFPPPLPNDAALQVEQTTGRNREPYTEEIRVEGVYIISVAARILEMHPQTLRKYERLGLIQPQRTNGMLRLYSQEDISKILLIRHLMENLGLNLAGVEFALALVANLGTLRNRLRSVTSNDDVKKFIDDEISAVFKSMNLVVQE